MKTDRTLRSQLIRLTKAILLKPPSPESVPGALFYAGKPKPYELSGRLSLTWWHSDDKFHASDAVAGLIIKSDKQFLDCDAVTVKDIIHNVLEVSCLDRALFDVDAVCNATKTNLFECRAIKPDAFADAILMEIIDDLKRSIIQKCTIYATPRLKAPSFWVPEKSIGLVSRADVEAWAQLMEKGYIFDGWSPTCTQIRGSPGTKIFQPPGDFDCVLVSEDIGTKNGTLFNSMMKLRVFSALMYASFSVRSNEVVWKSAADPYSAVIQFPHASNSKREISRSGVSPILPCPASDVSLDSKDTSLINLWYCNLAKCNTIDSNRIEKSGYFISRAINSDDIESFLNYFIALDALFGQRGAVESSIVQGVTAMGIDDRLTKKTTGLFKLRSEIVHGGSRYISEWSGYAKYTSHFRTDPMDDMRDLAYCAILKAPSHFLQEGGMSSIPTPND